MQLWNGKRIPLFKEGGRGKASVFSASRMNEMVNALNALLNPRISRGPSDEIQIADGSIFFKLKNTGLGGSGTVTRYRVKSWAASTLGCVTWDGTTEGGTTITVAKPYKLRNPASEVLWFGPPSAALTNVTVSYDYASSFADTQSRFASSTGFDTEAQSIFPRYIVNDEIWAAQTGVNTGIANVDWIDLNLDARQWCTIPIDPIP